MMELKRVSRFTGTWSSGMERWNGGILSGMVGGAANLMLILLIANDKMRYLSA